MGELKATGEVREGDPGQVETTSPPEPEGPSGNEGASFETVELRDVEIFEAGKHKGIEWTEETLGGIVGDTNRILDTWKPYVKLGHNESQLLADGQPSLGWLHNIRKVGRKIVTDIKGVPKVLAKAINAGAYKRVSVELAPDRVYGDESYPYLLRAVAFLGADMPEVKTLQDLPKLYHNEDDSDEVLSVVWDFTEEDEVQLEQVKALEEANVSLKGRLEEAEAQLMEAQMARVGSEAVAFADKLLSENKIRKDDHEKWVRVLGTISGHAETLEFSDGETAFDKELKELLLGMPKMAEEGEEAGAEDNSGNDETRADELHGLYQQMNPKK